MLCLVLCVLCARTKWLQNIVSLKLYFDLKERSDKGHVCV